MRNKIFLSILLLLLSSCGDMARRLKNVGKPPPFSDITFPENDEQKQFEDEKRAYNEALKRSLLAEKQKSLVEKTNRSNSLWSAGSRDFFRGKTARQIGDILKVNVTIAGDKAKFSNSTSTDRNTSGVSSGAGNVMGLNDRLIPKVGKLLGTEFNLPSLVSDVVGTSKNKGNGSIDRSETVQTQVAALVTKILPNGNLVIQAHQEIRVNHELREVMVSGIIRPDDIDLNNTINIDQIAEARVSYGGRGSISDVQTPKYGTQILDILSPF